MLHSDECFVVDMHGGVNRSEGWAAFHATGVKPFVFVLHFVNNKDAVEDVVIGMALVDASPYRGSLIYFPGVTPGHLNSGVQGRGGRAVEDESVTSQQSDGARRAYSDICDCVGLSKREVVCLVQMSVDGCFTCQQPYLFVCCIGYYKTPPTVPGDSLSVQRIRWKLF